MSQMAQHQAAELWELTRDHFVSAAKLQMIEPTLSDPRLRSIISNHAHEMRRAGERLEQFLQEGRSGQGFSMNQPFPQQGSVFHQGGSSMGMMGSAAAGHSPADAIIASACMSECKSFAVKCTWGATESSQPIRSVLHELSGAHLRMAEELYHWLEQTGLYADPKVDFQAINEYAQKTRQFGEMGRHIQDTRAVPVMNFQGNQQTPWQQNNFAPEHVPSFTHR